MKMYGRVAVQLHAFLTSTLDGGEWSASHVRPTKFKTILNQQIFGTGSYIIYL